MAQQNGGLAARVLARLPRGVRRFAISITEGEGRIATWLKARAAAGVPVPEPARAAADAPVRALIAPFNYSGQGWEWARSLREQPEVSAVNLAVEAPGGRGFTSDFTVPAAVFFGSQPWKQAQRAAIGDCTHLIIESFTSPLGNGRGERFMEELADFADQGLKVAFLCHGSDIRSPEAHRARSKFSPFSAGDEATRSLQQRVTANRRIMEHAGRPVFVSTPDLLHDVPEATWLPLVIDDSRWAEAGAARQLLDGDVPVIAHASTANWLKGSQHVRRAAERLTGRAEYHQITGMTAAEMPAALAAADIVVDQLLLGSYGVAACEAMALGRAVVGNVDPEIRARVTEAAGLELPIVQADPDTIETVLAELVADPERVRAAAAAGQTFVRAVHSGARTWPALRGFFMS